jgi:MFS family permease
MAERSGFGALSRTVRVPTFRNYMSGNFVGQLGMWVQRIAVGWLTWQLTESPSWLGIVAFADFFPNILMAPLAGALADRLDRLRAIRLYVFLSAMVSSAIAVLTLTDLITIHLLVALVLTNGTVMSFNYPVRLSIIHALVERDVLTSAISVNALAFNIARIGGPALAGFIIANWEVGPALVFTALSDIAFIAALYAVKLKESGEKRERKPAGDIPAEIMEGFRYAAKHPGIGPLLVLLAMTSIFGRPYVDLFPGFADKVFGMGAYGLSWLTSMVGVGAFLGSLVLARREGVDGLTAMLVTSTLIFAISLFGFVATDIFWVALLCVVVGGYAMVTIGVTEQTLLQSAVDGAIRGRVLSLYTLIARGCPSIGALLMGWAAEYTGLRWPVAGGAAVCLGLFLWARTRQARMAAALEKPNESAP